MLDGDGDGTVIGAFAIGVAVCIVLARSISKPVAEATEFTQVVSMGDISRQVPDYALRRGGEPASSMEQMAANSQ